MSTLLIGDIHGCYQELRILSKKVNFNPIKDTLWLTGDLVSRGPQSMEVLRYIKSLGSSARIVLGNHDLHLLAVYAGIHRDKIKYTSNPLLNADDSDHIIHWLRCQPILQVDHDLKLIMSHAGITPQWDIKTAQLCAREIEDSLSSNSYPLLLHAMYGDTPNSWMKGLLTGLQRLRFATNAFTRMRYCFPGGELDMIYKDHPNQTPPPLKPWFNLPSKILDEGYSIIFGHWASLRGQGTPPLIYALDTGCCWGNHLTMLRWEDKKYFTQPCISCK
ncbi:bis(5'-nucleosyl)-tetraphosphatase (symmetrical) ApaH [Candidatus Profftia sp. (ex Adelges kitamiensis)]|uniref:bis(5'-nucleosyl)-tetraphosphatase (symmetrical) ApaH n=1 Tax=Candidatus Profftia sp. (ex Adelges kitamiensis) TaxID=2864218 RepID=UPI001CE31ED8|nr:bis(5'-nucleosyl)-tetraphosphatase (symmetrical) ApaH [Candidatus Profftia sp. (ex Adelges kitamiensis)]